MKTLLLLLLAGSALTAAEPKRILFLAGPDSHAWDQHKHLAGSTLLCGSLREKSAVEAEVITTWPDAALAKADALVIYADGWHAHPANDKLAELEVFMMDFIVAGHADLSEERFKPCNGKVAVIRESLAQFEPLHDRER